MDEPDKLPVAGRVVWITPEGAQGNRQAGIGIEFSDQDVGITAKIEIIRRVIGVRQVLIRSEPGVFISVTEYMASTVTR